MKKNIALMGIVVLLLVSVACDSNVTKIANGMQKASVAIGEGQNVVKDVYNGKFITKAQETTILEACIKGSELIKVFSGTLQAVKSIDPTTKNLLLVQLQAVIDALDPDKITEIVNIKNDEKRTEIRGAFIVMRTALSSVRIIIESSGG